LVAAAAGVPVAKHANRAISGTVGAADLLEAMGIRIDMDAAALQRCLDSAGCCFIFAPAYHPAFRRLAPLRRELGIRTLFNLIGALGSPARPHYHLFGVADAGLITPMVHTLTALGTRRAMVVHGHGGVDEISLSGPTRVAELREDRSVTEYEIVPERFAIKRCDTQSLVVRDLAEAVQFFQIALGGSKGPAQDVLALNGGAAIYLYGAEKTLDDGVARAYEVLRSGRALEVVEKMRLASQVNES
jgi:anthranilate phosphoribosyltransferase